MEGINGTHQCKVGRAFLLLFDGSLRTLLARVWDYNPIILLSKRTQFFIILILPAVDGRVI